MDAIEVFMKKFSPKLLVLHLLVSFGVALLASYFFQFSFWICFLIVEVALLLNGLIAEHEDRRSAKKVSDSKGHE